MPIDEKMYLAFDRPMPAIETAGAPAAEAAETTALEAVFARCVFAQLSPFPGLGAGGRDVASEKPRRCHPQPLSSPPPTSTAVFRCDCFFAMEIRENVLTESNIRALVKLLDEEMDGVARDQRERLQNIEEELEGVKKRLARIWNHIETTDTEMADASDRIREHRERKEKLEVAAEEARALLKERRQFLDSADTIAAFAAEMSDFLKTSELTETKAFVGSFVKEVVVKPGRAAIVYSIPTPEDSPIGGADFAEVALNGRVMNSVRHGGPTRTELSLSQK